MPVLLNYPMFKAWSASGAPGAGYKVYTYAAGTSTPLPTYTTAALNVANPNPVILDANGEAAIWLAASLYKIVLQDNLGVTVWTLDNVSGTGGGSSAASASEWAIFSGVPTFLSATSFSLVGDQTGIFGIGRRLKTVNTAGTIYSTVIGSVFGGGVTTVTVKNDAGTLDSGLSAVSYGIIAPSSGSLPVWTHIELEQATTVTFASGGTQAIFGINPAGATTVLKDALGEWANASFTPKVSGVYRVRLVVIFEEVTALTIAGGVPQIQAQIGGPTDPTYNTDVAQRLVTTQPLFPPTIMEFTKTMTVPGSGFMNFVALFYFSAGSVRYNRARLSIQRVA